MKFANKLKRGAPQSTDEVGEVVECGVGMGSSPKARSGGVLGMGMSGSGSESSLNMGEWSTRPCISLRPNESSWKSSASVGEFNPSGNGSSAQDIEIVCDELECIEADKSRNPAVWPCPASPRRPLCVVRCRLVSQGRGRVAQSLGDFGGVRPQLGR